ncbi:DUF418 domain-containing protein [Zhihengliuella halotolerans]|uniref:DUF418 domain-containing protein n=1 Tax=Zhihengliuella halotolerans TaxID=370736 RepID=A0A4Q8AFW6_9MICC|nr:DUF418 domain-containing protein [Zhihengliuella halotolerans]RZU63144.1 uncharacterized protein EV380_2753 [Zhihengliuella halotolerans]
MTHEDTPHPQAAAPAPAPSRVLDLDALRAFALLGIFLVNVQFFVDPGMIVNQRAETDALGDVVNAVTAAVFMGKFYLLFSFLFGYSFVLLWDASARRGANVTRVALRRFLGLFVLGLAHGLLLFTGDILVTYALCGLILLAARHASVAAARTTAIVLTVVIGLGVLALAAMMFAMESFMDFDSLVAEEAGGLEGLLEGPYLHLLLGMYPMTLANVLFIQGPVALAMFFVGLAAAKSRWIENATTTRLRRILIVGLAVGLPGAVATGWLQVYAGSLPAELFAFGIATLTGPFLTAAYVTALLLAFRSGAGAKLRAALAPAGRMALTNYLTQSAVMALVYTDYGLDLGGRVHPGAAVLICLGVFAAQLAFSAFWMRRFERGPLEGLFRAFTYWRAPSWR